MHSIEATPAMQCIHMLLESSVCSESAIGSLVTGHMDMQSGSSPWRPFCYMVKIELQMSVCIYSDVRTCHDTMRAYFSAGNLSVHVNPVGMSEPSSRRTAHSKTSQIFLHVVQMGTFTVQKGSTSGMRKATGMRPMMRMYPQAGPMPTLGADPVLPGLLAAMAQTDTVMTTWLAQTLPTSPLRPLPPCKLLTRYAYYDACGFRV